MGAGDQTVLGCHDHQTGKSCFRGEVNPWGKAPEVAMNDVCPDTSAELGMRGAEKVDVFAVVLPATGKTTVDGVDHTHHRNHGGGVNGGGSRLVVEADVSAGDRYLELQAGVGEASH